MISTIICFIICNFFSSSLNRYYRTISHTKIVHLTAHAHTHSEWKIFDRNFICGIQLLFIQYLNSILTTICCAIVNINFFLFRKKRRKRTFFYDTLNDQNCLIQIKTPTQNSDNAKLTTVLVTKNSMLRCDACYSSKYDLISGDRLNFYIFFYTISCSATNRFIY